MNVDDTIRRITKEVKIQIEKKYPIEMSEEEILDVVDSQFRGTVYGLKKGLSIKLPVIGRFLFINKSDTIRRIMELNKIKDFYSEIEFEQKVLEGKIATIQRHKARWKKERETELTVVDVVRTPNISNGKIIYDRLSKLIEEQNGE